MDKLWAPWRSKYVKIKKHKACIFCRAAKPNTGDYVVFKTKYSLCMLNIYPYNNGHLMVAPLRHIRDTAQLTGEEAQDLFAALNKAKAMLKKILKPHSYNIGINLGPEAGAGITGHMHMHIVPRWRGDANFMPVLCNTKIVTQSLDELYRLFKKC